jgi:antitoxin VapB
MVALRPRILLLKSRKASRLRNEPKRRYIRKWVCRGRKLCGSPPWRHQGFLPCNRHVPWHMPIFRKTERHVKLFKNGRNQAVPIPRKFGLSGEDAIIRKDGVIEPAAPRSLLTVLAALPTLDEEFPPTSGLSSKAGGSVAVRFLLDANILSDLVRHARGGICDRITASASARANAWCADLRYPC